MIEVVNELNGKSAQEIAQILRAKTDKVGEDYKEKVTEKDGQPVYNFKDIAELEAYRKRHDELTEIGKVYDTVRAAEAASAESKSRMERILTEPVNRPHFGTASEATKNFQGTQAKSLGELFTSDPEYTERKSQRRMFANGGFSVEVPGVDLKTTMSTSAGFAPANNRSDVIVPSAQPRVVIQNFIPSVTVDVDSFKFMEQTTFTNNVAGTAEAAALSASAIAYTERTATIELIGGYLPVTEQQLEVPELAQFAIENDLMLQYGLTEQSQILTGDGSTPNLVGFLNKAGIQTQAKSTDVTPDAAMKLLTKLRGGSGSGYVEPDLFVFHPNDWQDIVLLRDANGNYIWGNPANATPDRLWGKSVLQTTAITQNTALAGDFAGFSFLARRRGARVEVGYQNDDFVKNLKTIKVTGRVCLVIKRAGAFGTLTGV